MKDLDNRYVSKYKKIKMELDRLNNEDGSLENGQRTIWNGTQRGEKDEKNVK